MSQQTEAAAIRYRLHQAGETLIAATNHADLLIKHATTEATKSHNQQLRNNLHTALNDHLEMIEAARNASIENNPQPEREHTCQIH